VPSGFIHLDGLLNGHGFYPNEVTVWAGAEGMGKTTALLSIARNAARTQRSVVIFTMEMEQSEIAQALISMETGIPRSTIQSKRISPQQWEQMVTATGIVGSWNLHVVDMHEFPALKPIQLRRKLRSMLLNTPIDLVILDGLWLMQPDESSGKRFDDVGLIMRDLSGVAKQFGLPIIVSHQYKEEIRSVKKPTIYHLAESAGVRRNAQVIIGMWRSSYFKDDENAQTYAYVMKNRNRGMIGAAPLPYNMKYNRFGDEYD
jgi:replicative DNA helicase